MRKTSLLGIAALAFFLCGCMNLIVPKTVIKGSIGGKPFTYSGPKDQMIDLIKIAAETNGTVSIEVRKIAAKMNPEVITTTADAEVKIITAIGNEIRETAKAAK